MKQALVSIVLGAAMLAAPVLPTVADETGAAAPDPKPETGVAIFGERLMHYRLYPDGTGSGRFSPPLPADDKSMLLAAMKALTRSLYGAQGINVEDMDAFNPHIGAITSLEDFDYDYRFMLDGSKRRGVSVILLQRKEAERTIDEELLLKELEAL